MSNLLLLPQLAGSFTTANNADWRDALLFVDANNNPIDLSGIAFHQQIKAASDPSTILLDLSTANGLLINGGTNGTLSWLVPVAQMELVAAGAYIADLVASDGIDTVNLFAGGPATVTVNQGVTLP